MGGKFKWPKVAEVAEYRRKVRELILKLIDDTPLQLPVTPENPWVSRAVTDLMFINNCLLF